jgi:TatA/E family protein of Tat protein translocase
MFNLGPTELGAILVIALLVFGPKKLPEIGKGLGQALREFKRTSRDLMDSFNEAIEERPRPVSVTDTYHSPVASTEPVYPYQPADAAPSDHEPAPTTHESHPAGEPHAVVAEHHPQHDAGSPTSSTAASPPLTETSPETATATAQPGHQTAHAPERTS